MYNRMMEELKATPEQQVEIDELIGQQQPINLRPNLEGVLDWSEYMKLFRVICTL